MCGGAITILSALLEVQKLKVHFPVKHGIFSRVREDVKAVDDVGFSVAHAGPRIRPGPGQVAFIGGKTSTISDSGRPCGSEITALRP